MGVFGDLKHRRWKHKVFLESQFIPTRAVPISFGISLCVFFFPLIKIINSNTLAFLTPILTWLLFKGTC